MRLTFGHFAFSILTTVCLAVSTVSFAQVSGIADVCPADLMVRSDVQFNDLSASCANDATRCEQACAHGSANACFAVALNLEEDSGDEDTVHRYFNRACELGLPIGCTNRAAHMVTDSDNPDYSCTTPTFIAACEADEAWSCIMAGVAHYQGEDVPADKTKAQRFFAKACDLWPEGDGCQLADAIAEEISSESVQ